MHLKSFLKDEFVKLVPFQDKSIVIELLLNFFDNVKEITSVDLCYVKDSQLNSLRCLDICGFDFSIENDVESFFRTYYKSVANTKLFIDQDELSRVYVPFFVKNHLYMVLSLGVLENVCEKEMLDDLDGISFYCSILLDRIEYAVNLQIVNQNLENLNGSLKKMNKKLNTDLTLAISDYEDQSRLAQEISQKSCAASVSKELLHEVSNPLSLIQFDLHEIDRICSEISLDKRVLDELVRIYNLDEFDFFGVISKIEKCDEKEFLSYLEKFDEYPLVVSVLSSLKAQSDLSVIAKVSSGNIQNVSSLIETVSGFGVLNVYEKEILDTRIVVNEVVRLFQVKIKSLGIDFKFSKGVGAFFVSAEKTRLYQVVINILKNSINAIENMDKKWISVDLKKTRNFISIIIVDSGPGFDQKELVYNIKKSSFKGRLGLGLLISKNILSQIGGKLVFNNQGKGMKVELKIPSIKG